MPEEWIRKQTLVNAERYITEELKEYAAKFKILTSESTCFESSRLKFLVFLPYFK